MKQNLMNANHKATNPTYRKEYDRIFRPDKRSDNELGKRPRVGNNGD